MEKEGRTRLCWLYNIEEHREVVAEVEAEDVALLEQVENGKLELVGLVLESLVFESAITARKHIVQMFEAAGLDTIHINCSIYCSLLLQKRTQY